MGERAPSMNWKRLLVPTDFSEASRAVLPYAIGIAKEMEASLTLAHVVPSTTPGDVAYLGIILEEERLLKEAKVHLDQFRAEEIPEDIPGENVLLNGPPSAEICKLARTRKFDLIVIATHGRTGLRHLWMGSTAEKIVRNSPCPVLTVRDRPGAVLSQDGNPILMQRILAPTDFSKLGNGALARAVQLAKRVGARLDLLHVLEPPVLTEFGYANIPLKEGGLRQLSETQIARLRQETVGLNDVIHHTLVRTGSVAFEIIQAALLLDSDLIVMATHGHKGLKHLALGSNAERVLRHAPCPVLIFPSGK